MKRIVILSGAGISAESGLKTFRDSDGLWENHNVYDVATPEAFARDPELVLNFYNERRHQVLEAKPNQAHLSLVEFESQFNVTIITQNIDDLHERAGSSHVLHLHGEIDFARSSVDETLIYPLNGAEIKLGDRCQKGSQLRPHIVWLGEAVPMMEEVIPLVEMADILLVIGTSLAVYPAAGLVNYAPPFAEKFYIDPNGLDGVNIHDFTIIPKTAGEGVPSLVKQLMNKKGIEPSD